MKRKILFAVSLSWFVLLASTQLWIAKIANANPHVSEEIEVAPLVYPSITILSPAENTTLRDSNNLTIAFRASIESGNVRVKTDAGTYLTVDLSSHVGDLYYTPSWQSNTTAVSSWDYSDPWNPVYFIDLTGIPDGYQTVTIMAYGHGSYPGTVSIPQEYPWDPATEAVSYYFNSASNFTFGFTVHTVTPSPSLTPNPFDEPTENDAILGVAVTVAVLVAGSSLLLYLIKKNEKKNVNKFHLLLKYWK